jgi:2-oxoglutarate dehydrogenase E1 component
VAGAIHLVVNNQIGFTTDPHCAGSARYCTDVAKMVEVPVIHVNGDDPEALVRAAALAVSYRQEFARDIVIDLVCYRRRGHHELDEPRLSQPLMYGRIDRHPDVWTTYRQTLKDRGELDDELVERNSSDCRQRLETALREAPRYQTSREPWLEGLWREISPADEAGVLTPVETGCPLEQLRELGERLTEVPGEMSLDRRVSRFLDARRETVRAGSAVNWSTAEALAFGTLLLNGTPVRIVGQDSVRGAFAQRHLALHDQSTGRIHFSHNNLSADQAPLEAVNSPLAEYATLGFEYGYSLVDPGKLVIWEAQFGDFCNGAQIIVDQFIATAEEKWSRMSGLVLLLPHGLEGQGPDHSSARPERFLQLCAKANMIVVNCSTPANYFHLLRRQVLARWRKPLVVMSPKSLLRHKEAVSDLVEFGPGRAFQPVIGDARFERGKPGLRRLILCSGKFYYELRAAQAKSRRDDVAIVRMEQLYPFPGGAMLEQLSRFAPAEVVWCQEEPENFGAWSYVRPKLDALLGKSHAPGTTIRYVGREAQSAAAGGSLRRHGQENLAIASEALG